MFQSELYELLKEVLCDRIKFVFYRYIPELDCIDENCDDDVLDEYFRKKVDNIIEFVEKRCATDKILCLRCMFLINEIEDFIFKQFDVDAPIRWMNQNPKLFYYDVYYDIYEENIEEFDELKRLAWHNEVRPYLRCKTLPKNLCNIYQVTPESVEQRKLYFEEIKKSCEEQNVEFDINKAYMEEMVKTLKMMLDRYWRKHNKKFTGIISK